jgi:hypothetical protein
MFGILGVESNMGIWLKIDGHVGKHVHVEPSETPGLPICLGDGKLWPAEGDRQEFSCFAQPYCNIPQEARNLQAPRTPSFFAS